MFRWVSRIWEEMSVLCAAIAIVAAVLSVWMNIKTYQLRARMEALEERR